MKMKAKKISKAVFTALVVFSILACPFLYAQNTPKIKFKEKIWDFGRVKQGKVMNHTFEFKNVGDADLTVYKVRTTCGCTAALISERELAPGDKGEIKVTFNTRGYAGNLTKYVYIETNDPAQPITQLTVSVSIDVPPRPKVNFERYTLDAGLFLQGEQIRVSTKVQNRGERTLEVTFDHRDATFFLNNKPLKSKLKILPSREEEIEILFPSRFNPGMMREYIGVQTNDPMRENMSLFVSGYIVTKDQLQQLFKKYKDLLD